MPLGPPFLTLYGRARTTVLSRRGSTWALAGGALGLALRSILPPSLWPSWGDAGLVAAASYLSAGVVACTVQRIRTSRSPGHGSLSPVPLNPVSFDLSRGGAGDPIPRMERQLRGEGWRTRRLGPLELEGAKGGAGFWGSILFHASLVGMVAGGAWGALAGRTAAIVVTEGESARIEEGLRGETTLTLRRAEANYVDGTKPVAFMAMVDVGDPSGGSTPYRVGINESVRLPGGERLLLTEFGYSPRLEVEDPRGSILQDAFVALRGMGEGTTDGFLVAGVGEPLQAEFFPDLALGPGGRSSSRSPEPNQPALLLWPAASDRSQGRWLRFGGTVELGRLKVRFSDLRPWVAFQLVRRSMEAFLASAFLALAGLALRFLDPERRVRLRVEGSTEKGRLTAWGRARAFPHFFQGEVRGLAERLAGGR